MAVTYQPIAHSTYLDYAGYGITGAPTVESAYGITDGVTSPQGINVALVLPRITDASGFLAQDWGTRQQTLEGLNGTGALWSTYGAHKGQYETLVKQLTDPTTFNLEVLHSSATEGNYVSSAEARTIWVHLDTAADFQKLFNTELRYSKSADLVYWNGSLSLPTGWDVTGLWLDYDVNQPAATNLSSATPVTLTHGPQSLGNFTSSKQSTQDPQAIADLYNFPLDGEAVKTGTIGLIEPGIGSAIADPATTFPALLTTYLTGIGRSGTGTVYTQGEDGQTYNANFGGERSLDVGVVAAVNPNSDIALYNGSGNKGAAAASVYTATQSAIWDTVTKAVGNTTVRAAVTSSSYADNNSMSPDSPFYRAYSELFVDAVLANQTTFIAAGDGGSGFEIANGLPNVGDVNTKPWNVMVGGTSLSTVEVAEHDTTLTALVASAKAGDRATIWRLVAGGLAELPSKASSDAAFVETVWNSYFLDKVGGDLILEGYLVNSAGSGGVDTTQSTPSYQVNSGISPVTSDPRHLTGRGVPDVSVDAGGNLYYNVPNPDMVGTSGNGGTSAASPLWASLAVQINTVFADQRLPNLGYMNDLLYTAAAISPAAFNDITLGNNTSSSFEPGKYQTIYETESGAPAIANISPTGYGYEAGWGYDLTSGLGSPNGLLLARALTAIAHSEMSFDDSVPQVLNSYGAGGWTSGAAQSLLIQTIAPEAVQVDVMAGASHLDLSSAATADYAWTARFAGQSERLDFQADLVRLFDRSGQGAVGQVTVKQGDTFAVAIDGVDALATTAPLTNQFGFVDFQTDSAMVRVARPVAVAETVDALNDQTAVVNIRQNGIDSLQLSFYRVDDFTGRIGNDLPGGAHYESAALARAYQIGAAGGAPSVSGPGYGQFKQVMLANVDAGDIVAMKLVNTSQNKTYWAFSQANEVVDGEPVGHIWNYGLNTWGFEDAYGGGDHDYNDLVVNIDFTSAFGNAWLVS